MKPLAGKQVKSPRRQVQIKTSFQKVPPFPFVAGFTHQVLENQLFIPEIVERQPNITLSLRRRIIHDSQQAPACLVLPGKGKKTFPCGVCVPGREDFQKSPTTVANLRTVEAGQEPSVKVLEDGIGRFFGSLSQVHETLTRRPSS